ncbi:MAG: NAD(P)-dependent alcohol dehydrogenase [Myxococcales bacterium]
MKAAVYRRYGPPEVVRIEELPTPSPGPLEVLVRVRATTVSAADWRARSLMMPPGFGPFARPVFGFLGPRKKVLGTELAGVVEAVGSGVTRFKPGDAVFAFPGFDLGAHAEYRVMKEDGRIAPKPPSLSFEEAAALCFGGTTALHFLRTLGKVQPGEEVLIIGASGAVGSAAVQLAKHLGARVTGVTSTRNLALVAELGASRVIDYTKARFTELGEKYDVIFDTVGATSFEESEAVLKDGGRLLLAAATLVQILRSGAKKNGKRVITGTTPETREQLVELAQLVEAGKFRPVIDRTFPLERIAEAHALVDSGHKRGSVVVTVG